jgi:hypothetical protein
LVIQQEILFLQVAHQKQTVALKSRIFANFLEDKMSQNEKLRTEDIIEILDGKILTSEGHPSISVIPREDYSSVLTKIAAQVLSPEEKLAFDSTLTTPSASNPVVLKDDLTIYIPQADLGEVKDSVSTFSLLPVPFTAMGSTIDGDTHVTIISTTGTIRRGDAVTSTSLGLQFATNTLVADVISPTEIQITPAAIKTSTNFSITFSPVEGDLRGVITDGIIYRWSGSAWLAFTRTGTMLHPELLNQNSDPLYQHLTETQRDSLLAASHGHANKSVLDGILSAGSGEIITTAERSYLPSATQKAALVGTSGTPSASNPYVTDKDPRLDTVRNPYVTVGPPGSLATFQGVDFRPFEDAVLAIDLGSAYTVKAIEVLVGVYDLSSVPIIWNTNSSSLLIEGFTPGTVTLKAQTGPSSPSVDKAAIVAASSGGPLIVRGITFDLNARSTTGIISYREGTIIEDCIFEPGATPDWDQVGVVLRGANSIVRRCKFKGTLSKGVEIRAANCRVENCTFEFDLPTKYAVDVYPVGHSALIDHCFMTVGLVNVQAGVNYANITNNRFAAITNTIVDAGTSTRYLENQPEEVNQPFIGRKRTVGPLGSYADYRGLTESSIIAALADPNVTEVEILEGTYVISSSITIPEGKALRGVRQGLLGSVVLAANAGIQPIIMSSWSRLENLVIEGSNASLVGATSASNLEIKHCTFELTAVSAPSHYEVVLATGSVDCTIAGCFFTGVCGVNIYGGSTRLRLLSSTFSNTDLALTMDTALVNEKSHIKENVFLTFNEPAIAGEYLLVENNHFLGLLPTKLDTLYSIWQGNYPHPTANNDSGVDTLSVSLDRYLDPSSDGVTRSFIASTGSISFVQDEIGIASTLPIALPARIDKTKEYGVKLYWTVPDGEFGNVSWRVTAVFRDNVLHQIGTATLRALVAARTGTKLVATEEDVSILNFNTSYGISSDPTHVSFIVERVGTDALDTLSANVHLLEVQTLLPRD